MCFPDLIFWCFLMQNMTSWSEMPFTITPDWLILSGVLTKIWSKSDSVVFVFLVGSLISWVKAPGGGVKACFGFGFSLYHSFVGFFLLFQTIYYVLKAIFNGFQLIWANARVGIGKSLIFPILNIYRENGQNPCTRLLHIP